MEKTSDSLMLRLLLFCTKIWESVGYKVSDNTRSDIAKIALQQRQQREEAAREQAFQDALNAEIDSLKRRLAVYEAALRRRENQPFSDVWILLVEARQAVEYKLNILCASDQDTYRKMKRDSADYNEWRADCKTILREAGRLPGEEGA